MPVNNMIRMDLKALGNVNTVFMLIMLLGIMLQSSLTHSTRFFHLRHHRGKHIPVPTNSDGHSPTGTESGDVTKLKQALKCQIVATYLKSIVSLVIKSCKITQ